MPEDASPFDYLALSDKVEAALNQAVTAFKEAGHPIEAPGFTDHDGLQSRDPHARFLGALRVAADMLILVQTPLGNEFDKCMHAKNAMHTAMHALVAIADAFDTAVVGPAMTCLVEVEQQLAAHEIKLLGGENVDRYEPRYGFKAAADKIGVLRKQLEAEQGSTEADKISALHRLALFQRALETAMKQAFNPESEYGLTCDALEVGITARAHYKVAFGNNTGDLGSILFELNGSKRSFEKELGIKNGPGR